MRDSKTRPWAWANDPRAGTWCLTLTRGIAPEEVLARYGADADTARLITRQQAAQLMNGTASSSGLPEGSLLRAGAWGGGWAFCYEDHGVMGAMPGPLSALSRGTETLGVLKGGDGMNRFSHWRDGHCTERFEPGFPRTRPNPPHPWWDAVQEQLERSSKPYPGLGPVLQAMAHHTGGALDTATFDGPLLTLLLEESRRTPDPPHRPLSGNPRPPGPALGPAVVRGTPLPTPMGRALNLPTTCRPTGTEAED
jgi:hypothetical protein